MKRYSEYISQVRFTSAACIAVLFIMMFSCTEKFTVVDTHSDPESYVSAEVKQVGETFYNQIKFHALEDPITHSNMSAEAKKDMQLQFDQLKNSGDVNFSTILNKAVSDGKISRTVQTILLTYNKDLIEYVNNNPDMQKNYNWGLAQENAIYSRQDLSIEEKALVARHEAILRYYVKFTLESQSQFFSNPNARGGGNDILCYISCAVNNISSFSSVGALAGGAGSYIGAAAGLIYTIINSASCGCNTSSCGAATTVSTPDACYSASNGLPYSAWGYGPAPWQFTWDFYREDLSNPPVTRATNNDQYTLTNAELNGASKVAVRVTSNCSGTYFYSQYYWTAPSDNGKPRPLINTTQISNNPIQVRYNVVGSNVNTIQFDYIPPYRGSVVAQTSNSVTVQWQSSNLRIGVNANVSSGCGTTAVSAY